MGIPPPQESFRQTELFQEFVRVYQEGGYSTPDLLTALEAMLGHGIMKYSKGPHQKIALERNIKKVLKGLQDHARGHCRCQEEPVPPISP